MLPPRIVRRALFPPLVLVITLTAVLLAPLLILLSVVAVPSRRGRRRALRLIWFGLAWLVMETFALAASLVLWIASGFGGRLRNEASLDRHYALVRWFLATLFRRATKIFRLSIDIDEPAPTADELAARLTRPVIVLSRHAGPGDSFLLVHQLLSRYRRRPRVVMKAALQLDPSLDVVFNRLPHAFVRPPRRRDRARQARAAAAATKDATRAQKKALKQARKAGVDLSAQVEADVAAAAAVEYTPSPVTLEIRRLAAGLGPLDALVIFPEGGNFTPGRWRRAIHKLEQSGRLDEAQRAQRMANLLRPRSGGAFAAIEAAPTADVIFVAHTGLDDLITVRDVWRALPMEQVIRARWWRVVAADVPRDRDEVTRWLYDWWERIDAWVAENRPQRPAPIAP